MPALPAGKFVKEAISATVTGPDESPRAATTAVCRFASGKLTVCARSIALPGHPPFPANRYVIAKAGDRKLVLYWYWAHDRGVASEYWAKYYLVADAIRMNRSDGALVRITTDMFPGETSEAAERRMAPFTSEIVPLLDHYIPR